MRPEPAPAGARPVWRDLVPPILALLVLAVLAHLAASRWEGWQDRLASLGSATPAIYLLLWLILVPCGFPAGMLALSAGFLFGPGVGAAWAGLGLLLSGLLMHALGRRWLRPRVARVAAGRPRLEQLRRAAAAGGVRLHVLARLSPLNYAMVSYTLAAGGAGLRCYVAGLVGGLPGLVAYVWLGAAAARGVQAPSGAGLARLVVPLLGGLSLLVLAVLLARWALRSWRPPTPPGPRRD